MKPITSKIRSFILVALLGSILVSLTFAYIAAMTTSLTTAAISAEPFLFLAAGSVVGYLTLKALPFGQPEDPRRRYMQRRLAAALR